MNLDPSLMKAGPVFRYAIGFNMRGNAESNPPTQAGVDAFKVVTDLQVSPHSLPALVLGKNTIRYWDRSAGARRIRITHRWREIAGRRPPGVVTGAAGPADGAVADSLAPLLRWLPAERAADYQVMVSARPDCRWPLSPALWQNVGSAATAWRIPPTFLNPGGAYYWKVRARTAQGDIGEWSRVFSFRTK